MNRKFILLFVIAAMAHPSKGQIAKWLIPPLYNDIYMVSGENLIITTDSLNEKTIWSQEGAKLATTNYQISSFVEGFAVTTKEESESITGFYDKNGMFTPLSECKVSYSRPYFSNNYLLVQEREYYRFVSPNGKMLPEQYIKAFPFANGYASCNTFMNFPKKKNPYNLLLTTDNQHVDFSYSDKEFDYNDMEFISSVNDENIGIVVAKHKLYYFNGKDKTLTPIFARKGESNLKNQAKLENELAFCISNESDSVFILSAKCGKRDRVLIRFNSLLIPISISLADGYYVYSTKEEKKRSFESPLKMSKDGNKYGLLWEENYEILPPQLDELITCFDDKAFVRLAGKCGMLQVMKDEKFKVSINKGNPIDFRHQKYETIIRLDLPKKISATKTRIEVDPKSGCEVDMPSEEKKDTEFGNYIQYNCVLNIPKDLPDEMNDDDISNEITYPTQILYDGLKSPIIPFKVKAWHYKYFNIDVNDAETSIHQGAFTFSFNIKAERNPGEAVYPITVSILTDSLQLEPEKISETRYKCIVPALNEGIRLLHIQYFEFPQIV